jgi:processive 1,2-diacylglycerol beta-glucosyltransferase
MKLLIISLSAGAGHVRVAEAIKKTAITKHPNINVAHIDLADYLSKPLKKTVVDTYALLIKRMPEIYGFLYHQTDSNKKAILFNKITKQIKQISSAKLYKYILTNKPDQIICTHPLPAQIILESRRSIINQIPVSITITDYDFHSLWLVPGIAKFFVANERMKIKMHYLGINENSVIVSGIPVDPTFYENKNVSELKSTYKINSNKTILMLSGGQGLINIKEAIEVLYNIKNPLNIIAIAGANQKLEKIIDNLRPPAHIKLYPVGWTDKIDEYMRMADYIITKPGGATITECMILGKPMILTNPIPGQEECNTDFILTNGFGQIARHPEDLLYFIKEDGHEKNYEYKYQKINSAETILENILNTK